MLYFYLFVLVGWLVGILRRGISVEHWLAWTSWPRTCGRNPSAFTCQVHEIQASTQHTWPCCIFCGCVFGFVLFCLARDKFSLYIAQTGLKASMLFPQPANCWSGSHYTCAFGARRWEIDDNIWQFFYNYWVYMCVCLQVYPCEARTYVPGCTNGNQRTTDKSQLSSSTMWIPKVELTIRLRSGRFDPLSHLSIPVIPYVRNSLLFKDEAYSIICIHHGWSISYLWMCTPSEHYG